MFKESNTVKKWDDDANKFMRVIKTQEQPPGTPTRRTKVGWVDEEGNPVSGDWPDNQGFEPTRSTAEEAKTLKHAVSQVVQGRHCVVPTGTTLDRFGGFEEVRLPRWLRRWLEKRGIQTTSTTVSLGKKRDLGFFFSVPGATFEQRSMLPLTRRTRYTTYEVVKPFSAVIGHAAAYYGMPGGAPQILAFTEVENLIKEGFIKATSEKIIKPR